MIFDNIYTLPVDRNSTAARAQGCESQARQMSPWVRLQEVVEDYPASFHKQHHRAKFGRRHYVAGNTNWLSLRQEPFPFITHSSPCARVRPPAVCLFWYWY